jgi:hypothetical protein
MAIDARVESIHLNENGGGRLNLIDRMHRRRRHEQQR